MFYTCPLVYSFLPFNVNVLKTRKRHQRNGQISRYSVAEVTNAVIRRTLSMSIIYGCLET